MKKIWAPWRLEYIKQSKENSCFICDIVKDDLVKDRENLILLRGKTAIILLNKYPYISGHLLVAPILHTANISEIPKETSDELWSLTTKSLELLKKAINPEGFNIGLNLGKVSGAGLKTHVHIHIVPRWSGDTNFMPILSDTRVISQALFDTYDLLKNQLSSNDKLHY
ncbi:MAG: HIT domain-containing protein [Candidatus Heimdallarchaeota archaeon]|nr:HIT domain-containing protein [Candidatus Heimdallarchaeota archaeon]